MKTQTPQAPLQLTLHGRTRDDVLSWLEDSDSDLAAQVAASSPATADGQRPLTLSAARWIEVCEGLYGHGREFGGTYARSAEALGQQLTERIGGYFLRGRWIDDTDCQDDGSGDPDARLHGLF